MAAALCAVLAGCVTNNETVAFHSSNPNQQTMMRDGQPALVSRQKNSIVLIRPASRQLQTNGRPVFVVGINNLSKTPQEFRVSQVEATQRVGEAEFPMKVVTFEMLQQEEKNRQSRRGASGRRRRRGKLLQRIEGWLRLLHDAQRQNWHILQSDSRGNCAKQRRHGKRSHDCRDGRTRPAKHGDPRAIRDQGQHADCRENGMAASCTSPLQPISPAVKRPIRS